MSIQFFEGPAGSGKTTQLMATLESALEDRPLNAHERVLALTKMHGSRQRMKGRLLTVPGLGHNQFECLTMDSFAWRILRRWRSLSRVRFELDPNFYEYDEVCRRVGFLLNEPLVASWVNLTFPIVIIDEMQDSKDGQLSIIQALSESTLCLTAADHFQDLDGDLINFAVDWARENAEVITLTENHRTSANGLLQAAISLRGDGPIPSNGGGFSALGALNHNVGASYVSRNLTWWRQHNDIAILTPVRPESSDFVRNVILRVEREPIGTPPFGPHQVPWEVSHEEEQTRIFREMNIPTDLLIDIKASDIHLPKDCGISAEITAWLDKQRRVGGRTVFTSGEIRHQIQLIQQRKRAHRREITRGVRAMTIHQAKNREFDSVIVLWPYEVQVSLERQRRLLYNAITRAKRQALVIVQNPNRLNEAPFRSNG